MLKTVLMLLLFTVSHSAMAEWVEAAVSDGIIDYVDVSSVNKGTTPRKMWVLTDFKIAKQVQGASPYLSTRKLMEFDCENEMFTSRGHTFFSQNMGRGDVIFVLNEPRPSAPVAPGTSASILFRFICDKG